MLVVAVGAGVVSVFEWQSFGWRMAGGILVSALLVSAAFPLMIMAVRLGEITFIAPFFFTAIPFAVILGYLFWVTHLTVLPPSASSQSSQADGSPHKRRADALLPNNHLRYS